jgi:hypothetical protein
VDHDQFASQIGASVTFVSMTVGTDCTKYAVVLVSMTVGTDCTKYAVTLDGITSSPNSRKIRLTVLDLSDVYRRWFYS